MLRMTTDRNATIGGAIGDYVYRIAQRSLHGHSTATEETTPRRTGERSGNGELEDSEDFKCFDWCGQGYHDTITRR